VTDVDTPDAPFQLADMAPRQRGRWLIPLLLTAAVLVGGGVVLIVAARSTSDAATPPATTSSAVLTGKQACERAFPLMQRVTELLVTWTGSTPPDRQLLGRLRQDLAELINVSPEPIRTDLGYQRQAVVDAISGSTPGPNLSTSSAKILTYCRQFGL
jgi:hypothetical protein